MGFLSFFLGIIGFGIGIPLGILFGFYIFIYFDSNNVKGPIITPLNELDTNSLLEILPEIPKWVKHPDYDKVDWMNKFLSEMWPYLDKAICGMIRSMADPIFAEYTGKYCIQSLEFGSLSLGTFPPIIQGLVFVFVNMVGVKIQETNEKELVFEPVIKWAGNPNISVVLRMLSIPVTIQLLEVHVSTTPRITLKPLVPAFPCFANIEISLLEKPQVDFGLKFLGADLMSIPVLYQFLQEQIRKQIASLYLWPQTLDIQILDGALGAMKKPVGILHVKVVRAIKLLKMDFLGTSDPYVQLSLSGERLSTNKTSIKMKNLNPEWNEDFKLTVKDLQSQVLQLHVYDWEKVGEHDMLGVQLVPLRSLSPNETKELTLDLLKSTNSNDLYNNKHRGKLVVELTFNPFKEDCRRLSGPLDCYLRKESRIGSAVYEEAASSFSLGGLLLVTVQGAEDVEGKNHNNPYALVMFKGEEKKTKIMRKTRDPIWNEEFQFVLEEAPLKEKIHIQVFSKRLGFGFRSKEMLGSVDINLLDVVYNGRINKKYHLINSRNGVIMVDIQWKVI